ncbi:MAG: polysaccharide deacetylase family protein [Gemmataceae bacterium]
MNIASFDVEEHHRIEGAAGSAIGPELKAEYGTRMEAATHRIVDQLAAANAKATFYIVGEIARSHPRLVRDIADAGHEIGSHSWDHRMVNRFNPAEFRKDLLKSKSALEDASGQRVVGFRADVQHRHRTPWAVDALVECGFEYDSSIFPVRHDRYGIPDAPRDPFQAKGESHAFSNCRR